MSFADRYSMIIGQASEDFLDKMQKNPKYKKAYNNAFGDAMYSSAASFTIAAEPNPGVALLDMVVMTTLGRLIWETYWLPQFGNQAQVMVNEFKKLESDIWSISSKVLTPAEQKDLRNLILAWRKANPEQRVFSHLRFGQFSSERMVSTLSQPQKPSGLLKSVKEATIAVDEIRLLAERGLYLGTRMPLLMGGFADLWVSNVLDDPQIERTLENMDRVSKSIELVTKEVQRLPDRFAEERDLTIDRTMTQVSDLRRNIVADVMDRVTVERTAAIDQLMDRFALERQNTLKDLVSKDEESVRGLLRDLNQTLETGSQLAERINTTLVSAASLSSQPESDSEPFKIKEYTESIIEVQKAAQDLGGLVKSMDQLLASPNVEKLMVRVFETLDRFENEGEELIDHTSRETLILILVFLFGALLTMLIYKFVSERFFVKQSK
jgi:archaellum component FlaC